MTPSQDIRYRLVAATRAKVALHRRRATFLEVVADAAQSLLNDGHDALADRLVTWVLSEIAGGELE